MPIQIIITGTDAPEVMGHLASFIGMRGMADVPMQGLVQAPQEELQGNGAVEETQTEAAAEAPTQPKRKGRPPKAKMLPVQEESEAEAEAETQAEGEDEAPEEDDVEKDRNRVRAALNSHYVDVYGMEATVPDVLALYKMRFPDGSVTKVSDIPEGMHDTVIQDIKDMSRTNHFKRKRVDQQL